MVMRTKRRSLSSTHLHPLHWYFYDFQLNDEELKEVIIRNFDDYDVSSQTYVRTTWFKPRDDPELDGNDEDDLPSQRASNLKRKILQHRYLHLGIEEAILGNSPGMQGWYLICVYFWHDLITIN